MFDLNCPKGITLLAYLPGDLENIIILQYAVPTLFSTFIFPLKDVLTQGSLFIIIIEFV